MNNRNRQTRRSFLFTAASGVVAGPVVGRSFARAAEANETLNVASIGVGGPPIDRSFVQKLIGPDCDATLIKAIIAMSGGLGLDVIAEGVEEKEELERLDSLGCSLVQGFYFSRPISAELFGELLVQTASASGPPVRPVGWLPEAGWRPALPTAPA